MKPIGKELEIKRQETVEVISKATQFSVVSYDIKPHSHEVNAEVVLLDSEGNSIGGNIWVQLNPIPKDEEEVDNWALIKEYRQVELENLVKLRLIEEHDGQKKLEQ